MPEEVRTQDEYELLRQRVKQFIEERNICVVATSSKNIPRASTVNYVADGFTLYVVTSGKSTKVKNVKENPKVSVAIDDHGKTRLGLQAEGIAKILSGTEAEQAKDLYTRKRDLSHHKPELVDTIIKIELKRIMFSDYTNIKEG